MEHAMTRAKVDVEQDAASFEAFFRASYQDLVRALLLVTGDQGEAEDLGQEALARVYQHWGRVKAMESPRGYMYSTALNLSRKRWRRLAVRNRRYPIASQASDPLVTAEIRLDLLRRLSELSRPQREALVLVEWMGLDSQEAGRVLGVSASSVRTRLHRAKSALREAEEGSDE
jgi:RNA polymerase sigma-70 factor (ECF subfamily)